MEWHRLLGLLAMGAVHGISPGMGWLFAVARGLQDGRRRALWAAVGPLAAGHALAIAAALALAAMLGTLVPGAAVRPVVGVALAVRGAISLVRHRHPRGGGMRLNRRELVWWSFLMATAHGAGLMALPLVMTEPAPPVALALHGAHAAHASAVASLGLERGAALASTAAHTIGYLAATSLVAAVVYERVGIRVLRSAWINVDLLWAAALLVTGIAAIVL
jgi:hypothetical protein